MCPRQSSYTFAPGRDTGRQPPTPSSARALFASSPHGRPCIWNAHEIRIASHMRQGAKEVYDEFREVALFETDVRIIRVRGAKKLSEAFDGEMIKSLRRTVP